VTARQGNGGYDLKLTVRDSAGNYRDTMIYVVVDNSKGDKGMMAGFSNYVYGASAGNEIYVGEITTGKIYRYKEDNQLIDTFQLADSIGIGYPIAMTSSDSGKIWIANITSQTINRFSSQGNFEYRFGGHLSQPSGITLDNAGNLWVTDRLHHKIKKFSPFGDSLLAFGGKGSVLGMINEPLGIDYYDGKLYVADSKNKRISVFDTLGNFITVLADSAGLSLPFGIIIDSTGCFTVSDFQGNQVIEFDPWGSPLFTIDTLLDSPSGLALSSDQERLYISDTKHKRVLAYEVRSDSQSQHGGGQSAGDMPFKKMMFDVYPTVFSKRLNIRLHAVAGKKLALKIYDVTGRLIKNILNNVIMVTDQTIIWDGKDEFNRSVSNGIYFIQVDIDGKKKTDKALMIR
jgi:DNA-binding beta-propeller fold protein YncE